MYCKASRGTYQSAVWLSEHEPAVVLPLAPATESIPLVVCWSGETEQRASPEYQPIPEVEIVGPSKVGAEHLIGRTRSADLRWSRQLGLLLPRPPHVDPPPPRLSARACAITKLRRHHILIPMTKETRLLRIGILGCGPISQFAHFDACRKARNAELYAVCDLAEDLLAKMAAIHEPRVSYRNYEQMLADQQVEAVLLATADQDHAPLALKA